ncbi:MAG: hypothetical protein KGP01_06085 [Actinomycetales bacterium]|nr:hypothetical protein [Actinomycetales bacterium]
MEAAVDSPGRLFGLSQADALLTDGVLDLGAAHPSAHGMTRLRLALEGDGPDARVLDADVVIGSMHRGAEKLFESRDYRQVLALSDRHDWLSPAGSEAGAAIAMETMLGIEPPRRAQLLRMLVCEVSRVAAHALFLAEFPWGQCGLADCDAAAHLERASAAMRAWRERLLALIADATGARMHVMWTVIGGVHHDLPQEWVAQVSGRCVDDGPVSDMRAALAHDDVVARLRGAGVVTPALVERFAMSGVLARSCGAQMDARRDRAYLAYSEFGEQLSVPVAEAGDALARLELLLAEQEQSLSLIAAISGELASCAGAVNVTLPKVVRLPEGSIYAETENALGINGYWLVSRGDKMPHRLKIRSASFNNVAALPDVLRGMRFADLVPTLATWLFISGDIDR